MAGGFYSNGIPLNSQIYQRRPIQSMRSFAPPTISGGGGNTTINFNYNNNGIGKAAKYNLLLTLLWVD